MMSTDKDKNESAFVNKIRKNIHSTLTKLKAMPLENLVSCANQFGISLDVSFNIDSTWRKSVMQWMKLGPQEAKAQLKLQDFVPTLAEIEREDYNPKRRGDKSHVEREIELAKKKAETQHWQKEAYHNTDKKSLMFLNTSQ